MAKKIEDDNKVMDVSKPGKGKIIMNSRPVVAPIVSNVGATEAVGAASSATSPEEEVSEPLAPSASHRVIQPLSSNIEVTDESTEESINVTNSAPADSEPTSAPEVSAEQVAETSKPQPAESNSAVKESIPPSSEKPVPKPIVPKPIEEKPKSEPQPKVETKSADSPASSDAAGVDAMAGAAEAKKLTAQETEEQARRDAAVKELINSKKYVVPINHDSAKTNGSGKHHEWLMVLIILILAGLIAGYLLVDAGVISTSIKLPYEFIKD
jgi:hypothetical protein